MILPVLAALGSLLWVGLALRLRKHTAGLASLAETPLPSRPDWPKLSVIVPAKDEEDAIESALTTLLQVDYPALELIVVNDRSTDRTGEILDKVAARDSRVVPVHVQALPSGWLGKLHALERGLEKSTGDWILFTDADIHFGKGALKKSVDYCVNRGLDHLTLLVELEKTHLLLRSFYVAGTATLGASMDLVGIESGRSRASYMGIGAFNLVRRSALEKTPGLSWLRMELMDDMGLAYMLRKSGARCAILGGRSEVRVNWYPTIGAFLRGVGARSLMLTQYRFGGLGLMILASALFQLAPWVALFSGHLWAQAPGLLALVVPVTVLIAPGRKLMGLSAAETLLLPIGLAFTLVSLGYSWITSWKRGGLLWRGTLYRLDELREHQRVRPQVDYG